MRLLETDTITFHEFTDGTTPSYAILSHTWGREEVKLQDMQATQFWKDYEKMKKGYEKVKRCCDKARSDGYGWVWIDTCCIDKTSSAELSEAINSMYRWYKGADVCYAYLADVQSTTSFISSRWFTRGWTLQELIAPSRIRFLNENWAELGTRESLFRQISSQTRIPESLLLGKRDLETFSVAQRMSWAAHRETTRVEDRAYCLLGIFGIYMPLIYGEGERAFTRLQEEIMRVSDDHTLFAWRSKDNQGGLLATSPDSFAGSSNIVRYEFFYSSFNARPPTITSRGIYLDIRFLATDLPGLGLAVLHCRERGGEDSDKPVAIYVRDQHLTMREFERVQSEKLKGLDIGKYRLAECPIRTICVRNGQPKHTRRRGGSIKLDIGEMDMGHVSDLGREEDEDEGHEEDDEEDEEEVEEEVKEEEEDEEEDQEEGEEEEYSPMDMDDQCSNEIAKEECEPACSGSWKTSMTLLEAAMRGDEGKLWMLLTLREVEADFRSGECQKVLSLAVDGGHWAAVRLLLSRDEVEADVRDSKGRTHLSRAAEAGNAKVVTLLLKSGKASIDMPDDDGSRPLSWAARRGHENLVNLLLDSGAEVNARDQRGQTAVGWCIGSNNDMATLLISRGADLDQKRYDEGDLGTAVLGLVKRVAERVLGSENRLESPTPAESLSY